VSVSRARFLLVLAAGFAALFVVVLGIAYSGPGRWVDALALRGFWELPRPYGTAIFDRIAHFADPEPFFVAGSALVVVCLATRRTREAVAVVVLLVGANFGSQFLQDALAHDRPSLLHGTFTPVAPNAYPSGHATAAMSLSLAAVLVAPRALRPLAAAGGMVFTLAVSFALLIRGWHYPSDVIGGFSLAACWCLLVLAGVRLADEVRPDRRGVRIALERGAGEAWAAVGAAVLFSAILLVALALPRLPRILAYIDNYTLFAVVAAGTSLFAAALLGGVAAITTHEPEPDRLRPRRRARSAASARASARRPRSPADAGPAPRPRRAPSGSS
jgi:membrane-associated phospholipid phosphatase